MENYFGKKRKVNPDAKKAMRLKYKEGISLKEAWAIVKGKGKDKVKKLTREKNKKNSLENMTMKKLEALAKKHKVSIYKKDKTKVKKSTLIRRLKAVKKSKFGDLPIESITGSTLAYFKERGANMPNYLKISKQNPIYNATYNARHHAALRPSILFPGTINGTSLSVMPKNYKFIYGEKGRNQFGNSNKIKIGVQHKLPYGTIGNVFSDKLNIIDKINNYKYTCLSPPPSTTRGSVAAAYGTPNF